MNSQEYRQFVHSYTPVLDPSGVLRINRGPLNHYDACLFSEYMHWDYALKNGLRFTCCPRGKRRKYNSPPWTTMPAEGRRFKPIGTLPVAGNFTATDIPVMTMVVDTGYDGVITDLVCEVSASGATGFVEGSGDVTWRLQSNLRYLRDLGDIQTTLGSLISPGTVPRGGLRIYSRDTITFYVNLAVAASGRINPNATIICSVTGWMYPR